MSFVRIFSKYYNNCLWEIDIKTVILYNIMVVGVFSFFMENRIKLHPLDRGCSK